MKFPHFFSEVIVEIKNLHYYIYFYQQNSTFYQEPNAL